ncbi:hypothetical protein F5X96DRAFT_60966 [Biscogniauxia mediterranea]|nr:hypothetical protein F5X96DRAFT_60966 [Biscogniauxia mediterranea]
MLPTPPLLFFFFSNLDKAVLLFHLSCFLILFFISSVMFFFFSFGYKRLRIDRHRTAGTNRNRKKTMLRNWQVQGYPSVHLVSFRAIFSLPDTSLCSLSLSAKCPVYAIATRRKKCEERRIKYRAGDVEWFRKESKTNVLAPADMPLMNLQGPGPIREGRKKKKKKKDLR